MSKAIQALTTPTLRAPTRRGVISGAVGIAGAAATGALASCTPAAAATLTPPPLAGYSGGSPECFRLRALAMLLTAESGPRWFDLEDGSRDAAAGERWALDVHREMVAVCRQLWQRPVRTWADVSERAEAAYCFALTQKPDGFALSGQFNWGAPLEPVSPRDDILDQALLHLLAAVVAVGGVIHG